MEDIIIVTPDVNKPSGSGKSIVSENVNGERRSNRSLVVDGPRELKCQVDLGTGNTKCCVLNCSTNNLSSVNKSQINFITFPKDPSRFTEWVRAVQRSDLLCYMGRKEATNILVCSRHFSENMWVNSNTRLKRLHKNAVPEMIEDDDINIISVSPAYEKPMSAKKSGLKVKKVTSLLTDSALRDSFYTADDSSELTELPEILLDSPPTLKTGRKWPAILQRPKSLPANSSEMEKKLYSENNKLKSELDKNMDYILNQKTHYEGLLTREKGKVSELEEKIKALESGQRKLWVTYESHLQAQKTAASSKDVGQKELVSKVKLLEKSNDELSRTVSQEKEKAKYLKTENNRLVTLVDDLMARDVESPPPPRTPPPTEINFTGEKFKDFLDYYLLKEKHLEDRIGDLTIELEQKGTAEGQKNRLLNLAAQHLNHLHLSWLKWILNLKQKRQEEFDDRLRELALSIYEASEGAYVLCAKAFGLPSAEIVRNWRCDASSAKGTTSSTVNSLYEEAEPFPSVNLIKPAVDSEDEVDEEGTDFRERKRKRRKMIDPWEMFRKRVKDEDEFDEGRVSDEDEEIFFTDSEDEEEEDEDEEEIEDEEELETDEKVEIDTKKNILFSPKGRISERKVENFDFIMDENILEDEDMPSRRSSTDELGKSMPLLEPESPRASTTSGGRGGSQVLLDPKISSKKKIISSDSKLRSGSSKVVFRVIES